jgi:Putative transmembrane protein (PGPGW)
MNHSMKSFKRIMIMVSGGTVLAIGVAMIVLPGPAFIIIPAGLAILAIEFAWARRWLRSARAVLPKPSDASWTKKLTMKSFRRSGEFLWRQFRRAVSLKRKIA